MSGSVSRGKNDPSQSFQMIERPLMTPDELKSLPKGDFIVMKTGVHPMRVHLKLFFKWGIKFDKDNPYSVPENGNRIVQYAEKEKIMDGIIKKYHPEMLVEGNAEGAAGGGMVSQSESMNEAVSQEQKPHASRPNRAGGRGRSGKPINTKAPGNRVEAHSIEESASVGEEAKESAEA